MSSYFKRRSNDVLASKYSDSALYPIFDCVDAGPYLEYVLKVAEYPANLDPCLFYDTGCYVNHSFCRALMMDYVIT